MLGYATKQPQLLNLRVIIAKIWLLVIPTVMIIFDITNMYEDENKLILIANCAVLFYLIYANINSNISAFKYKKLMDQYVATVSELSVVNERSRFARDTHDTIGHTMSRIIGVLEKCRDSYDNTEASAQMLNAAVEYAKDGFQELRRSIIGMIPEKLESDDLESALKNLFSGFNALDVKIDFAMYGKFSGSLKISEAVYKICQEVLTDSILYGNKPNIRVVLRTETKLQLSIFNEGTGCEVLKKGFGMSTIEQRVKELGGQMKIIPTEGEGFHLNVIIPNINVPLQVY
jgi:signal transduction histidine kinase